MKKPAKPHTVLHTAREQAAAELQLPIDDPRVRRLAGLLCAYNQIQAQMANERPIDVGAFLKIDSSMAEVRALATPTPRVEVTILDPTDAAPPGAGAVDGLIRCRRCNWAPPEGDRVSRCYQCGWRHGDDLTPPPTAPAPAPAPHPASRPHPASLVGRTANGKPYRVAETFNSRDHGPPQVKTPEPPKPYAEYCDAFHSTAGPIVKNSIGVGNNEFLGGFTNPGPREYQFATDPGMKPPAVPDK